MKKFLLSCIAIVAIAVTVNAQNPQVQVGPTAKSYSVGTPSANVDPNGYTWSLNAAGSTAAPAFSSSTTSSQSIIWSNAAPNVTITVVPKSTLATGGCSGVPRTYTIDVVNTLTYTVQVQTAPAAVCPAIAGVTGSGDIPAPVLQLNGFVAGDVWSVTYTIDAAATTYTSGTHAAANGFTPVIDNASKFQNLTAIDATHTIHITSCTVNGLLYTPTLPVDVAYTVHPAPTVGAITTP